MFNRQPYNRGKFNVASLAETGNSGIAMIVIGTSGKGSMIIRNSGNANIATGGEATATIVKYGTGKADIKLGTNGIGTKVFITEGNLANIIISTMATSTIAGESSIILENLGLKTGDELVINTCDMTITINGQNAMEYFTDESDFFNLLNGLNTLIYQDGNANRKISFDVIWKDRWL